MKKHTGLKVVTSILIFVMIGLFVSKHILPTFFDVYSLKGDYVPSIKTVLHETKWVSNYTVSTKNHVLSKKIEYMNQEDVIESLKIYTNYLIQMEEFQVLKPFDLKDYSNSSIYLGKVSHINEKDILLVNIEYTSDRYTITVSKKKGTILN